MDTMKRFVRFPARIQVNALFVKILGYFLSLLIPTLIIGCVFYMNFVNKLKHDFADKMSLHLQSVAATVDVHLGTVQRACQSILANETVRRLLIPDKQMTIHEKADLYKLINALNSTGAVMSNLVDSIFAYVDGDKVYMTSGAEEYERFFTKTYRYDRYGAADWLSKLGSDHMFEMLPLSQVDIYGIQQKAVVPYVTTGLINGNRAVVVANISVDMVQRAVLGNHLFPATEFLVTDASGNLVYATDGIGGQAIGKLTQAQRGDAGAQEKIMLDGSAYLTTFAQADVYGWHYYAMTPVAEFNRQAAGVLNLIILICSALLVVGFALSFLFTFRIYNPIKKIREVLVASEETMADGVPSSVAKNELMSLRDGVHELYRASETYRSKLTVASLDRLEHALVQLLRGNRIQGEEEIAARLAEHFGFRASGYLVCAVDMQFKEKFYRDIQDVDRFVITGKLKKLIAGLLKEYAPVYVVEFDRQQFACIVNMDEGGDAALRRSLDNLMRTFAYDALYCIIHIGVGSASAGLSGIGKSYNEALTALHNRDRSHDFQVIEAKSLDIEHRFYYSFADENKLLYCMKKGDAAGAEEAIRDVLRRNEARNVSHRNMHMLLTELYNTSLRYATEREWEDALPVTEEEHLQLSGMAGQTADFDAKLQLMFGVYRHLSSQTLPPPQDNRAAATVTSIIRYIEENYGHDLYLEKIAQEVGISSKYVSRMFKEKTGVNLTDYISMFRMAKAKELLVQTNLSISDIAQRVGIFSRATFLRLFKKYEGISPNEFRKCNA